MLPFPASLLSRQGSSSPVPAAVFSVEEMTPVFFADASPSSTIIPVGTGGDWDLYIREIGNVVDTGVPGSERYVLTYTGHNDAGYSETTTVYIGYATSSDGENWTKGGKLLTTADLEDPWLMKIGATWYLFCENKGPDPQVVQLYTATSLAGTWTDQGTVLSEGTGWESVDVSSPVVWVEGGTWKMLYEGRSDSSGLGNGSIGMATASSAAGPWTKSGSNPLLEPSDVSWVGAYLVPDDIQLADDGVTYVVAFHGSSTIGGAARARCGVAYTEDFLTWTFPWETPIAFETWDDMTWQFHPVGNEMQFVYCRDAGAGIRRGPHMGTEVLVMNFTGADTSTTMTDESIWGHAFTASGNAQILSNKLELDGTGDYLSSDNRERWKLRDRPYTIELFDVVFDVNTNLMTLISQWQGLSNTFRNWRFDYRGDLSPDILRMLFRAGGSDFFDDSATWTPTVGVAYDICIERDEARDCRFYIDGVMLNKTAQAENFQGGDTPLRIGTNANLGSPTDFFDGRIDAIRMNVGKALYANDGGYTVPSLPLVPALP